MSLTLGEKLRQAREERGISVSEVAEQTRISPHYIESIENNDFKILPGGIFNKGFIKSFAKYVGVDENEALQDYSRAIAGPDGDSNDEPRAYRPEVLTDDRASASNLPTIILAVVILGLMTGGILFLLNYLRGGSEPTAVIPPPAANANTTAAAPATPTPAPVTDRISVEITAVNEPVWTNYSVDGKPKIQTLAANETLKIDANESFKIAYSRSKLANLRIVLNGREMPTPTTFVKGNVEFEVNKSNIAALMETGTATQTAPAAAEQPVSASQTQQSPTAAAVPTATAVRTPQKPAAVTSTPRPAEPTPAAKPSETPIVVGRPTNSAN